LICELRLAISNCAWREPGDEISEKGERVGFIQQLGQGATRGCAFAQAFRRSAAELVRQWQENGEKGRGRDDDGVDLNDWEEDLMPESEPGRFDRAITGDGEIFLGIVRRSAFA
jgi:hypothetical protein